MFLLDSDKSIVRVKFVKNIISNFLITSSIYREMLHISWPCEYIICVNKDNPKPPGDRGVGRAKTVVMRCDVNYLIQMFW